MYISRITISGFRNFKEAKIPFHDGVNVIIGHNNTGKSNLLRAIALVLGHSDGHGLRTSDMFFETDLAVLKQQSPRIKIQLVFHRGKDEDFESPEMALFSDMMIDPALSEEAQLGYEFRLSEDQEENYKSDVAGAVTAKEIWKIIDRDYFRLYKGTRYGGKDPAGGVVVQKVLSRIDFQFLDAIRDVGRDLYAGYNPLLREVLNFFIDYSVKNDETKNEDDIKHELKILRDSFMQQSTPLMQALLERLQEGKVFS